MAYSSYLFRHKLRVFVHATLLGVPIRGLLHDLSKFTPVEWEGIGRHFYPSTAEEKERNAPLFAEAKAHHRERNPHEIDHWYRDDVHCDNIPVPVLKEVVADWAAFGGLCFTKSRIRHQARMCYEKWAHKYRMHPDARAWIEDFLDVKNTKQ